MYLRKLEHSIKLIYNALLRSCISYSMFIQLQLEDRFISTIQSPLFSQLVLMRLRVLRQTLVTQFSRKTYSTPLYIFLSPPVKKPIKLLIDNGDSHLIEGRRIMKEMAFLSAEVDYACTRNNGISDVCR